MFDIGQYYTQAHSGEPVENTELLNYIKSFPQIVLWGGEFSWRCSWKIFIEKWGKHTKLLGFKS